MARKPMSNEELTERVEKIEQELALRSSGQPAGFVDKENPARSIRLHAKLSGAELARRLNMSPQNVSRIEGEGPRVEFRTILRIAEACGFELSLEVSRMPEPMTPWKAKPE